MFYSMVIGDVDYLPETGNILITSGIAFADPNYSTIAEVAYPGKQVVFEAKLYYRDYFAPENVEGWTGHDIAYRSERVEITKLSRRIPFLPERYPRTVSPANMEDLFVDMTGGEQ